MNSLNLNSKKFILHPGQLTLEDLKLLMLGHIKLELSESALSNIDHSNNYLATALATKQKIYGVNTGFGLLANQTIDDKDLATLQENLILSHATGVGEYIRPEIVRIILALKINSLALGYSGVRLATIQQLIHLYNHDALPCIPEKGSVGASGDLAPLAHLSAVLLGYGNIYYQNKMISAKDWLLATKQQPYSFIAKEGLALLNGTQVTTAFALYSLIRVKKLLSVAIHTGAMSVDAAAGSRKPFTALVSKIRNQPGQMTVAARLYDLLEDSEIIHSHSTQCNKVQDPYSLRCQPQVIGACLQQLEFSEQVITNEINAVTDNPLIFSKEEKILFGGNFHAEPIGFAADNLALVIAELGSIAERRIALLLDKNFSGLPLFLVKNSGLNSGFMIAQVTAASLVSENKALATPTVIDTIPTSSNQEDHVSMATYGARRLIIMSDNCSSILAIELLAAAQGIDLRRPLKTSKKLEEIIAGLRQTVSFYDNDRYFYNDIVAAQQFITEYDFDKD